MSDKYQNIIFAASTVRAKFQAVVVAVFQDLACIPTAVIPSTANQQIFQKMNRGHRGGQGPPTSIPPRYETYVLLKFSFFVGT